MKITLSHSQWTHIGKSARWFTPDAPSEGSYGHGLNQEAMKLLKLYDIGPHELWKYDSVEEHGQFNDIYQGLQEAKKGNINALKQALEGRYGKKNWLQKTVKSITPNIQ